MSPGAITSSTRGGYSFSRSSALAPRTSTNSFSRHALEAAYSQRTGAPLARTRDLGARQRFTSGANADGNPQSTLDPGERVQVGQDADGNVTISGAPANTQAADDTEAASTSDVAVTSESVVRQRRAIARQQRQQERLLVAANPDGSVTLAPSDPANQVLVVGNPASGEVEVVEVPSLEPQPA